MNQPDTTTPMNMEFFIVKIWDKEKKRHVDVARFKTLAEARAKAKTLKGSIIEKGWKPGFAPF